MTQTIISQSYMYKFKDLMYKLPKGQFTDRLNSFSEHLGVSKRTVYRYMNATWENPISMPPGKLRLAALFWDCTIDDLINQQNTNTDGSEA